MKKKQRLLGIVALDMAFLLASYLLLASFSLLVIMQYSKFSGLTPETLLQKTPEEATMLVSTMGNTLGILIALIISYVALMLANFAFFQGMIYARLAKKRFNLAYFLRFLLLTSCIFMISFAAMILAQNGFRAIFRDIAAIAIPVLSLYFGNIVFLKFAEKQTIRSIREALRIGVVRFYRLALPNMLLVGCFALLLLMPALQSIGAVALRAAIFIGLLTGVVSAIDLIRIRLAAILLR